MTSIASQLPPHELDTVVTALHYLKLEIDTGIVFNLEVFPLVDSSVSYIKKVAG